MNDEIKLFIFGIVVGVGITWWLLSDRPSNPYEVCIQYWGQRYYAENGGAPFEATAYAQPRCEYEKTAYDGKY